MTKKDYVKIAEMLNHVRIYSHGDDITFINGKRFVEYDFITRQIADILQGDNERFDRKRFIQACNKA